MNHRPYPNVDRARHQLDRHSNETRPHRAPRPMTPFEQRIAGQMAAMMKAAQPSGVVMAARLRAAFTLRPVGSKETST